MLLINLIRTIAILFAVGLFHIYTGDYLTFDEGVVVFCIAFFGLTIEEIVEKYVIDQFNRDPKSRDPGFPR